MPVVEQRAGIQSLRRALALMELLERRGVESRLTDIAAELGLSKSTAHNILNTLIDAGYVKQNGTRYSLDLRLRTLSRPLEATETCLLEAFTPALRAFSELTGENTFLAVPSGTRSYLTLGALGADGHALHLPPDAKRDSLLTSAVGKVFLAHDVRLARRVQRQMFADLHENHFSGHDKQTPRRDDSAGAGPDDPAVIWRRVESGLRHVVASGFALDLESSQKGLHCVALPLRMRGKVVAAISASAPAERLSAAGMRRLAGSAMRELFSLVKC